MSDSGIVFDLIFCGVVAVLVGSALAFRWLLRIREDPWERFNRRNR